MKILVTEVTPAIPMAGLCLLGASSESISFADTSIPDRQVASNTSKPSDS